MKLLWPKRRARPIRSIPIKISSGAMRQELKSLRGRPEPIGVPIKESDMKQIKVWSSKNNTLGHGGDDRYSAMAFPQS